MEWIKVEDKLPEEKQEVLIVRDHGDRREIQGYRWDRWWKMNNVTHWMPFPKLPPQ